MVSSLSAALAKCRIIPLEYERPRGRHVQLDFRTVPLISVLFLLACRAISLTDVRRGILGADGVKPIDIMSLFISLVRPVYCRMPILFS